MKNPSKILLVVSLFFTLTTFAQNNDFFLGGIQINEPNQEHWTSTLKNVGFNTVEVTVYAKQGDWDSDNLWWNKTDTTILKEVRAAKKIGLKVVLILRVALDHAYPRNEMFWHGMIFPKNEQLTTSWFTKYAEFTKFWSIIAEQENIDLLVIGSEMNSLTSTISIDKLPNLEAYYLDTIKQNENITKTLKFEQKLTSKNYWDKNKYPTLIGYLNHQADLYENWSKTVTFYYNQRPITAINIKRKTLKEQWKTIISTAKSNYNGPISYAANFDNYMFVDFWNELNFIGINAYFALSKPHQQLPDSTEIKKAWLKIFSDIENFKASKNINDKPIIFTELGYTFKKNCTVEPWNSFGFSVLNDKDTIPQLIFWRDSKNDYAERDLAVKMLLAAKKQHHFDLKGILYWKLSSQEYHKEIEPFMLHLSTKSTDLLQQTLLQFME